MVGSAKAGPYLAPFSSRGPTADDRIKPDVVAPGVTVGAAARTTNGYVVESGTSMATPFVAGTAALTAPAADLDPDAGRAAIEGTAQDVGPSGKDNDWGAGLLDGYGAVAQAAGATGATPFPLHRRITGTRRDNGSCVDHVQSVGRRPRRADRGHDHDEGSATA